IVVGVAILAGARFARWFWILFALGMTFAFGFVVWLISQSIFDLNTLCPWCMVTWVVTIPSFYAVWLHILREGIVPASAGVRRAAAALSSWIPVL
ncbi:vitamin K epoxide reductase family protein, partial [Escherichia coli]